MKQNEQLFRRLYSDQFSLITVNVAKFIYCDLLIEYFCVLCIFSHPVSMLLYLCNISEIIIRFFLKNIYEINFAIYNLK